MLVMNCERIGAILRGVSAEVFHRQYRARFNRSCCDAESQVPSAYSRQGDYEAGDRGRPFQFPPSCQALRREGYSRCRVGIRSWHKDLCHETSWSKAAQEATVSYLRAGRREHGRASLAVHSLQCVRLLSRALEVGSPAMSAQPLGVVSEMEHVRLAESCFCDICRWLAYPGSDLRRRW